MSSFQDILNTPMEEIKPPKPLPPGEYLAIIDGQPEVTQRGKNNNHCVVFPLRLVQALDSSPAFQQQVHDALEGKQISDVKLSNTLWLTNDAAYRLKNFLSDHLGIVARTPSEALSQAPGKQLIVSIGHYIVQKEGEEPRIGMEIKSTGKAA
jgi:hypothetical protein